MSALIVKLQQNIATALHVLSVAISHFIVIVQNLLSQPLLFDVSAIVQGVQEIRQLVRARRLIIVRITKNVFVVDI